MKCPQCSMENESSHRFCEFCGSSLEISKDDQEKTKNRDFLLIQTIRIAVTLLGLAVVNSIITDLDFVQDMQIPDFDLDPSFILSLVVYLVGGVVGVRFLRILTKAWPKAFPNFKEASVVITAGVVLILLTFIYKAARPMVLEYFDDRTILLILQIILVGISIGYVGRACKVVYSKLPIWIKAAAQEE